MQDKLSPLTHQRKPSYGYLPPHPDPATTFGPPPAQQVLLGFVTDWDRRVAVYGPPGAQFDRLGNVYFSGRGGRKHYVGMVRGDDGKMRTAEEIRQEDGKMRTAEEIRQEDGCCVIL